MGERLLEPITNANFQPDEIAHIDETDEIAQIDQIDGEEAWKEARGLASQVYAVVGEGADLKRDYRFRDQLTAAAVSVISNIAEGFSRRSTL